MNARQMVGANIRRLRKDRSLTQEQLSELANLSQQHFSDLERGYANPTLETLAAVAAALRVKIAELFEEQ